MEPHQSNSLKSGPKYSEYFTIGAILTHLYRHGYAQKLGKISGFGIVRVNVCLPSTMHK